MKRDVYEQITGQIVAELEKGVRPWFQPWSAGNMEGRVVRPLRHNGMPYQGINTIVLWTVGMARGYAAPSWFTYRQASELKAQVRKGEKGSLVVYADKLTRTETDAATGEEASRDIHFMKGYTVFNAEQIDGLPEHYYAKPAAPEPELPRIERAETFFAATCADIRFGGDRAYYAIGEDRIQMPPFVAFRDPESYYATLAHETTHWTRHPSRLDREFGRKRWGDEGYAMEELVAELGSAFLGADLGLSPDLRADHASYIDSWLTVLKRDSRAIFTAASHAQRAADFLHGLQPQAAQAAAA